MPICWPKCLRRCKPLFSSLCRSNNPSCSGYTSDACAEAAPVSFESKLGVHDQGHGSSVADGAPASTADAERIHRSCRSGQEN